MIKIRRLPTILGLLLLVAGLAVGVFVINNSTKWALRANPDIIPKQIKITNITDTSFSVSWITDGTIAGAVRYGTDKSIPFTAKDDRDETSSTVNNYSIHHATLKNLSPSTSYYFKILSQDKLFDNNGQEYVIQTAPLISQPPPPNDVAYGIITKQDGSPAPGVIVYLTLANATEQSTITKSSGSWVIPLSPVRSKNLTSYLSYDQEASIEELTIQGGAMGTASVIATTKYDSPMPTIALGKNYDFRKGPSQGTAQTGQQTEGSGFASGSSLSSTPPLNAQKPLAINSPKENEKINTQLPEFNGTGPAGETLEITVNSASPITGQTTILADGTWKWAATQALTPGSHTITIKLTNGKSATRSFIVLALGGSDLPAYSATPSATLSPTVSPKATSTPTVTNTPSPTATITPTIRSTATPTANTTASPTISPSATPSIRLTATITPTTSRVPTPTTSVSAAMPQSGILTPTIIGSIMGIFLLGVGFFLVII